MLNITVKAQRPAGQNSRVKLIEHTGHALAVKEKINEIESAQTTTQVSYLKQFRSRSKIWYKIEITVKQNNKIYWMLCVIRKNNVELRRIKPEIYFKKNF